MLSSCAIVRARTMEKPVAFSRGKASSNNPRLWQRGSFSPQITRGQGPTVPRRRTMAMLWSFHHPLPQPIAGQGFEDF